MRWIGMSEDGERVTLRRFNGAFRLAAAPEDPGELRLGAALDVETTGLDRASDAVIEIGLRTFSFDRSSGALVALGEEYAGLEDPGRPVPAAVTRLTGLDEAALRGQRIDWARVRALLEGVDVIIAHNAAFDRAFVDRALAARAQGTLRKIWACSYQQIDWAAHGFGSAKLELLNLYHGFFVRSHRALADVDALLHLLTFSPPEADAPYLAELLERARRPSEQVVAARAPHTLNPELKRRGYRWDGDRRAWTRECEPGQAEAEAAWLRAQGAHPQRHTISPYDRFRA